jgi:hypothetical protein
MSSTPDSAVRTHDQHDQDHRGPFLAEPLGISVPFDGWHYLWDEPAAARRRAAPWQRSTGK